MMCGTGCEELAGEFIAIKDVVAQYQSGAVHANKVRTNQKGFSNAIRARLGSILDIDVPLSSDHQ